MYSTGKQIICIDEDVYYNGIPYLKAISHLNDFVRGLRAKGKIQMNNYQYGQGRPSFAGKTSSVSFIAYLYERISE